MPRKGTHRKALILLVVFSLNTVISFACSLGGVFHNYHHHAAPASVGGHHHGEGHHHDGKSPSHHDEGQHEGDNSTDCCSTNIVEVEKVAKSVSRTIEAPPVSFLTLLVFTSVYPQLLLERPAASKPAARFRWRVPATIQDLRIVMQSFQI